MGRKMDVLLGRNSKESKIKTLSKLAISRMAILRKNREVRLSHAWSDVIQLLSLGHQERALLRVEHVIKEQNMVDAFCILECYCHILGQRGMLMQKNMECPEELKEAASSLTFAASRCGDFPELQGIRTVVTKIYGKEFVARAVELRKNCAVNPRVIEKFSTRQPSVESRMKALKEIAYENGMILHFKNAADEEKAGINYEDKRLEHSLTSSGFTDDTCDAPEEISEDEGFSDSMEWREYNDVVGTAQDSFESVAHAAAAARAAVRLSASGSGDHDPDDQCNLNDSGEISPSTYQNDLYEAPEEVDVDPYPDRPICDNIYPVYYSDSEEEETEADRIYLETREKNERQMHQNSRLVALHLN
ncbi:uncharacterized protein LOC115669286 isoform X2 [Syzygium oleosum]|uniref:uncharacterized protein LOC115669286 isoform X2 n=1 Tax=Syzygium oleosum TaxID=219896 RepID=UPI0024B9768C|nr:uncharacterized protein LOC115669286 isoform X2 [Syzygium oleosum]